MPVDLQAAVEPVFRENFERYGELGASVSAWLRGREVVSLAAGWREREKTRPWAESTPVLVYSATKGPAAACVLVSLEEAGVGLDEPVARVWPGFGQAGKDEVTFAQVLSHRAGLPALDDPPDAFDYKGVIRGIERQRPHWMPGVEHGYHPRTSGYMWDEIVRRVAGMPLGHYWRRRIAEPLGLDFWMGLPEARLGDVAVLYAPRVAPPEDDFMREYGRRQSLTHRAFTSPNGLLTVSAMNTAAARVGSFPGFGGIGTARALARFYGVLATGGEGMFGPAALAAMPARLSNGFDRILRTPTAFSAGFLQDPINDAGGKTRASLGPGVHAFGQVGAGGSVGFADPDRGLGFAYVMNQMDPGVTTNGKGLRLIAALYEAMGPG